MIVVETQTEISEFLSRWNNEPSIIIPVWCDLDKHPMNNELSFLFVVIGKSTFILIYNHIDGKSHHLDLSTSTQPKWVWNKKGLLQTDTNIQNLFDISAYTFSKENKIISYNIQNEQFISHYMRMNIKDNLGKIAPLMKWGEYLKSFVDSLNLPTPTQSWTNDTVIPILSDIERLGIRVVEEKFIDRWKYTEKHIKDGRVYTEYNPYTITGRPSNRHAGVNFSALNKKDGSREVFIPKEGKLFLQFDYDAYHPRIIGDIVGYELPKTSVHQWLAEQYGCGYDEGKGITFQLLYGGIPEEFLENEFFKKVNDFIELFWKNTQKCGWIQTTKRRIPLEFVEEPNAQKVFNYLLQSMETEYNIEVLCKLKEEGLPLPILYVYDSFLFEFDDTEVETIKKVKEVLEGRGFPVSVEYGKNYSDV